MAFRQQTHRLDGVDVVVGGAGAQNRLQQHFGLEDVAGASNDLLRRQADTLAVVVNSVADLDEQLFQRGLRESRRGGQLVAEGAVDDRVRGAH